jgi:hypothetical protein
VTKKVVSVFVRFRAPLHGENYVAKGHAELSSVMKMEKKLQDLETLQNLKTMTNGWCYYLKSSEGSKILSVNSAAAWKNNRWSKRQRTLYGLVSIGVMEYPST